MMEGMTLDKKILCPVCNSNQVIAHTKMYEIAKEKYKRRYACNDKDCEGKTFTIYIEETEKLPECPKCHQDNIHSSGKNEAGDKIEYLCRNRDCGHIFKKSIQGSKIYTYSYNNTAYYAYPKCPECGGNSRKCGYIYGNQRYRCKNEECNHLFSGKNVHEPVKS